jgi:hypothetical protein
MGAIGPSRNRVVVPTRQSTYADGIDFLESILGLLKSLNIRAQTVLLQMLPATSRKNPKGSFVTKQGQKVRG